MALTPWIMATGFVWLAGVTVLAQTPDTSSIISSDEQLNDTVSLREAAANGSSEAMLELGFRADRGQGEPRDPTLAFTWYMQAAQAGLAEAQLNVGIMLDAGIGTERDPYRAIIWYTRAALRGNARAQFNLGLLYDTGLGTPENKVMGNYWFNSAKDKVPAAADKIMPPDTEIFGDRLTAPVPVYENVTSTSAEVIWRSEPQPEGSYYLLQLYASTTGSEPAFRLVKSVRTQSSGALVALSGVQDRVIWRISVVDDALHDYAASEWRGVPLGRLPPRGAATLAITHRTTQSTALIDLLQSDLKMAGISIDDEKVLTATPGQSRVIFRYRDDRELAMDVAGLLTSDAGGATAYSADSDLAPGQVGIELVIGPNQKLIAD